MNAETTLKSIQKIELTELDSESGQPGALVGGKLDIIKNLKVRINVTAGSCEMTVKDILGLRENTVLTLDKQTDDPVDIWVDGALIARGSLVAVGDNFGVRITEILVR